MSSVPPGFGQNPNPGPYGSNPYGAAPPPYQPPGAPYDPYGPKPSGGGSNWVLILLAIIFGSGAIICICCGVSGYYGFQGVGNIMGEEVAQSLEGNPVIEEHIGTINKCEWNFIASTNHSDEDIMVFDVEGSKGSGKIYGELSDDGEGLLSGELKTSSGTFDLFAE